MDDLKDATRDEILQSLEYAMRFRNGKATNAARDVAVSALASMVLEHLELSGYVIKKKPPRVAHSTSGGSPHLKD
jgi:hypothetical protein